MNYVLVGDSITAGLCDTQGGWATRLQQYLYKSALSSQKYCECYNLGISGNTSKNVLNRIEKEVSRRLDDEEETYIIIAIGINDSQIYLPDQSTKILPTEFRSNLQQIALKVQQLSRHVAFVGLTPVDEKRVNPVPWKHDYAYSNAEIKKYDAIIQEVSKTYSVHFIDMLPAFSPDPSALLYDGLHPNDEGHKIMFDRIKLFLEKESA